MTTASKLRKRRINGFLTSLLHRLLATLPQDIVAEDLRLREEE